MMTMNEGEHPVVPPADGTAARRYYGKYAGVVKNNAPPDAIQPGTIQVQVPGILEETPSSPAAASGPAPPPSPPPAPASQALTVLALPSFLPGFYFIPQEDAPVWVEFVAGDINYPIWTGVWYPTNAAPQDSDDATPNPDQKVIRTPSGQVIHLSDKSGGEKTVVKDEKNGNTVTLDKSGITIESQQQKPASAATITMDESGVTITFGQPASSIHLASTGITITDGTGSPQSVVLGPLITWLLSHTHIGNMGAPTPLNPAQMATLMAQQAAGNQVVSRVGG